MCGTFPCWNTNDILGKDKSYTRAINIHARTHFGMNPERCVYYYHPTPRWINTSAYNSTKRWTNHTHTHTRFWCVCCGCKKNIINYSRPAFQCGAHVHLCKQKRRQCRLLFTNMFWYPFGSLWIHEENNLKINTQHSFRHVQYYKCNIYFSVFTRLICR